ncbi:MAG TPA: helix-turn-helix domain-containing protein [Actinomycetota bacterium]|nr:helix-turn-helix domain-containing protein [Actinomycetota bacterium]
MGGRATLAGPQRRPGRPPKELATDTRVELLEAALELFARHGYAGTSVRMIARSVGVSEAAMYAHFPGKRAMFEELLEHAGPRTVLQEMGAADGELPVSDPARFVRRLVERVWAGWEKPAARRFLSILMREGLISDPSTGVGLLAAIADMQRELGSVFARWQAEGRVRVRGATPEQLAWELFSTVAVLRILHAHADAGPAELRRGREAMRRHVEFFVAAVFGDGAATGRGDDPADD